MSGDLASELVGGRYRLEQPLGAGGMGRVWQAHDTVLQRDVAIKAVDLPSHLSDDDRDALRSRVMREARAAARIDHPSTVRVYDVVEDGNRLYVVMELVLAPTLEAVVGRQGPLAPARAATVGLGLLGALEAAHGAGIVHRDVKPANVMMLDDGSVKLADFGIASVKDDTRITAAGFVLGTPSYMAPEQAAGRPAEGPADLWGLGALLYYAVEGVPPFERGEALPTLHAVLHDEPRPMERADGLAPAVQALLSKEPEARPSLAATRASLERLTGGGGVAPDVAPTAVLPGAPTARVDQPAPPPPPSPPRSGQRPAAVADDRPGPGRGANGAWLAALGLVALVAVAAAVLLANAGDPGTPDTTTTTGPATTAAGDAPTTTATTTARSSVPATTAAPAAGPRPDGVPSDWVPHADRRVGYTIWHPPSWAPTSQGDSRTDLVDPATGDYLRVDYVEEPGDDPEEAWQDASDSFAGRYDDYEELRIEEREYQGFPAAVWEYTYQGKHATNLGFVTDDYGFALNFQTAEERWDERQDLRRAFEAAFVLP